MFKRRMYQAITCADGFTMSVQANSTAYCDPRSNEAVRYNKVEIGFPNDVEPMILDYAEDVTRPTETVYGYVPVGIVTSVIAKHGGMVEGEVPPGVVPLKASSR